jgi:O-glycosyl hydrolase
MKDNNSMLHGGKLKPEYYETWAGYYGKFIHAYEKEGIPIWGLTVQNEPMAIQSWESCIYTAEEERDFLKNYLGPALQKDGLKDKRIIIWDHNCRPICMGRRFPLVYGRRLRERQTRQGSLSKDSPLVYRSLQLSF